VLEALGVDFEVGPDDIAARGNFCTVDANGLLTDRRAGRIPSAESSKLVDLLRQIRINGVELFIEPVKEHRFAFILRARGFEADLTDSDPLITGTAPLHINARTPGSTQSAAAVNEFISKAQKLLEGHTPANMILLRGFSKFPTLPGFKEIYKLNSAAVAVNGMYRGVARLAGMDVLPIEGFTLADEFTTLEKHWQQYDFFYLHYKKTDTCGEMGDFEGKVKAVEEFDTLLPRVMNLNPDVVVVTGDHSSPAVLRAHSWHPVPLLIYAGNCRPDGITEFGERACAGGSLGCIPATGIMPLALAHAGRVAKYGA
jgi:2,3-bisphosphoglycerate-independent phosphoglycerate mutase